MLDTSDETAKMDLMAQRVPLAESLRQIRTAYIWPWKSKRLMIGLRSALNPFDWLGNHGLERIGG